MRRELQLPGSRPPGTFDRAFESRAGVVEEEKLGSLKRH
jgi:hypothetical protein